jgi:hypothetical protein
MLLSREGGRHDLDDVRDTLEDRSALVETLSFRLTASGSIRVGSCRPGEKIRLEVSQMKTWAYPCR